MMEKGRYYANHFSSPGNRVICASTAFMASLVNVTQGLIGRRHEVNDRMLPLPSHGRGKLEHHVNRIEQRAIPMVFQDAPAPLDRV